MASRLHIVVLRTTSSVPSNLLSVINVIKILLFWITSLPFYGKSTEQNVKYFWHDVMLKYFLIHS